MALLFFLHIIILIAYGITKALVFVNRKNRFFRNLLTFFENSGFICFFLFFHMIAWVFVFYNFKQFKNENTGFILSLIVSIAYLITTVLYYAYLAYRLLGPGLYFMEDKNVKKFAYFFCGYKRLRKSRNFDLWRIAVHFFIALLIGCAFDEPIVQTVFIMLALITFIGLAIWIRPWIFTIQMITEIFMKAVMLIIAVIYIIMASKDKNCKGCGDREGGYCWIVMLLTFLVILVGCIAILGMLALLLLNPDSLKGKA